MLARALEQLDERYQLARKVSREPELASILKEFIGRLRRAFGSLTRVKGKRILDIASGSNSSRSPTTGKRTAMFEPWFARLVLELGAEPVALDAGDLDGERFEHHRVDLGKIGSLDFLAAASFDGVPGQPAVWIAGVPQGVPASARPRTGQGRDRASRTSRPETRRCCHP